jgi:predicted nuclease with TOPRIM domain
MVSFYKELQKAFELLKEQNTLLVAENKLLKATVADLKSLVSEMAAENKLLKATIADLKEGHTKLIQENHQLKEKLGLNSTNSSLPPSRDLYVKKQNYT